MAYKIQPGKTLSLSAMEKLYDPNFQDAIKEIISVVNPLVDSRLLIKSLFSELDFEILEVKGFETIKIRKISTNEIFSKGDSFYHKKYKEIIKGIWFDQFLTGCDVNLGSRTSYYVCHVRGNSGLYNLSEMISMDRYKQMKENGEV